MSRRPITDSRRHGASLAATALGECQQTMAGASKYTVPRVRHVDGTRYMSLDRCLDHTEGSGCHEGGPRRCRGCHLSLSYQRLWRLVDYVGRRRAPLSYQRCSSAWLEKVYARRERWKGRQYARHESAGLTKRCSACCWSLQCTELPVHNGATS